MIEFLGTIITACLIAVLSMLVPCLLGITDPMTYWAMIAIGDILFAFPMVGLANLIIDKLFNK